MNNLFLDRMVVSNDKHCGQRCVSYRVGALLAARFSLPGSLMQEDSSSHEDQTVLAPFSQTFMAIGM
jgi:hypothetical protein